MASDEIRARLAACPSGPPTIHQALDYVAHYARDVQALLDRIAELEAGLREMLASAVPHPVEHPTMTAAWAKARALLDPAKGGAK